MRNSLGGFYNLFFGYFYFLRKLAKASDSGRLKSVWERRVRLCLIVCGCEGRMSSGKSVPKTISMEVTNYNDTKRVQYYLGNAYISRLMSQCSRTSLIEGVL